MLRGKQIGAVTFDTNTLFIQEQLSPNGMIGKDYKSAAGTDISYSATDHNPTITLDSQQNGLLTEAQCDTIATMYQAIDTTYTLTYDDDTTDTVRFRHDKRPTFVALFEGSCQFRCVIYLSLVT